MRNLIALPLFFLLFPASLQAQLMTGVEAYSQEICIGETLQFNGQLFRWPITVEPLFIRDSDGREWDPDAEVSPEGTSVYTFYYRLRDGHDTLSEQAEVIRLRLHGGNSFADIADILNIPVSTAKSRFQYGIDKIRNQIKRQ